MTTNIILISQTTSIVLWTLCCMLFLSTTGHTQTTVDTIPASQYFAKADTLLTHRKLDSAVIYFKKALPIYRRAKTWECVARSYNKISESLRRDKKYDESLTNAKQAIAISDQYLPKNNREKAYGYDNIGDYYYNKSLNFNIALEYYQKALKVKLRIVPKDNLKIANSYIDLGSTYFFKLEYDRAINFYKKSLAVIEKEFGSDHVKASISNFCIGLAYYRKEEYNKALPYLNRSLLIKEKQLSENHIEIANCNNLIGRLYRKKGEYDKALPYLEKYLSILIHRHGREHDLVATALNQIGIIYKYKGKYDKALRYYKEAVKIKQYVPKQNEARFFSGIRSAGGSIYNNIGVIYKDKGEYDKALNYYKRALHINLEVKGKNSLAVAINCNNIGNIYRLKGNYDQALENYHKALTIRVRMLDKNNSNIADSHNDIGELYNIKEEYNKAINYAKKALVIRQNVFGTYHSDVADSYVNFGNIYKNTKEYNLALENYQKALEIRQNIFGAHHPKVAVSNNDIANVYTLQKDYKNSLLYYEKAVKANIRENRYLNRNILLTTLLGKAKTYTHLYQESNNSDDLNQAITTYKKADALINDIRQTFTTYQDKVGFAQKAKVVYQGAIQTQLLLYNTKKKQKALERAFYYAEKSKANTLKELLSEANAKSFTGLPNDVVILEKELRIDKAFYQSKITESFNKARPEPFDKLSVNSIDSSKITHYENKLFEINRRQDSLTAILEKNYPKYYQLKHENNIVSIADIQKKLNERTTVVEFFTADSSTYVFTVSKHKMVVQEVSTPDLTGQIEQLREAITSQELSHYKTIAHKLYTTLIHPIKDQFIGDELIIVPDGPLWHC
ncbi:tetratricopeptide repeat protein, partial [Aquimarina algiphila]|uniref:tetratricopeptide repeat protein n=1 Tax=Aquimarina algiphila TaxID=2047982 RepID=UPI00232D8939